ncbi:MAG: HEPN domain-containing protein [Defluviitaleaceae bacterium]|nr:HEPN domain-containing protein [Defluviitaleaceae bacterium]
MNAKYSYRDIASEDLLAAGEMLKAKLFNHSARQCQQYVEKIFKECLTLRGTEESDLFLLHTHKLARLAERCGVLANISFSKTETAFFRELTDYYFDTNYPGENYIKLSETKAKEVYEETLSFKNLHEVALCARKSTRKNTPNRALGGYA